MGAVLRVRCLHLQHVRVPYTTFRSVCGYGKLLEAQAVDGRIVAEAKRLLEARVAFLLLERGLDDLTSKKIER